MRTLNPYLVIGQVLRPQGLWGELKIKPITDDIHRFERLSFVWMEKGGSYQKCDMQVTRISQGYVYATLDGCADRNAAEQYRNMLLYVDRAHAVQLPEGRYFICDIEGCEVLDAQGNVYGTVREVIQAGSNDVYVIQGKIEYMLPILKDMEITYNIEEGTIIIQPEMLFEVDARAH